ncbi:MAG: hypothetical protein IKZ01_00735 [Anaerotignum sp.]|nr:hypothetical protein [Anaerotignum sp.]MBR5590656.1 hypothetical protein [Anaerotignum sp.]
MKRDFENAKKAVEKLFWDTCYVEIFAEESTEWGETLHSAGEEDSFPCRLTEKAKVSNENGLLTKVENTIVLLYPAEKEIKAGSAVRVRKENGAERRYTAAGESLSFLTHKAVGLKRSDVV